ncbi:MAG: hypothetical protein AAF490_12835 [Chloroflexota bacterium]
MDPITTTIIAAILAGATVGATDVGAQLVVDAYQGVKTLIIHKFGAQSDLADAIEKVEARADSDARQAVLQEEVAAAKLDQDDEILAAVQALHKQLKENKDERIQTMIGSFGGEQFMRGKGGKMAQKMKDSPHGKQRME